MRALELFSGGQSFGKVCRKHGIEVISVDIKDYNKKFTPTHKTDILEFNYRQYPRNHFDIVWSSPPCLYYSVLQRAWLGRERINHDTKERYIFTKKHLDELMNFADRWVLRTLEIINYFNPEKWYMENPNTGNLKNRPFMKDLPYYVVDYCQYTDWGYKKNTRVWTNIEGFTPKKCHKECPNKNGTRHKVDVDKVSGIINRYRVPPKLIEDLLGIKEKKSSTPCCIVKPSESKKLDL
jgi:site-specific DNA-cytosine methylase